MVLPRKTNLEVIDTLCEILDRKFPERTPHSKLKTFVKDRPGHDHRYAIDFSKIKNELDWAPSFSFEEEWKRQLTGISAIKNGVKMSLLVNIKGRD